MKRQNSLDRIYNNIRNARLSVGSSKDKVFVNYKYVLFTIIPFIFIINEEFDDLSDIEITKTVKIRFSFLTFYFQIQFYQ